MALQTKTISSSTTSNGFTLVLELIEESTSLIDNISPVSYELKLKSKGYDFSSYRIGWSISLNNITVSTCALSDAPQLSLPTNSTITIASGKSNIKHNPDGTLNMSVSANITMASASYTPGNMNLSGSMTLTKINNGVIYIDNGTGLVPYQAYIDNGTGWDLAIPYIDNGTGWDLCG